MRIVKLIPGVKRIDHIGIAVHSLDSAISLYQNVFGGKVIHEETNIEEDVSEVLVDFGGQTIQLLAPISGTGAISKFLSSRGEGIQQIAIEVEDLELACAAARENEIRVLYTSGRKGTLNSKINFLHPKDCGGVLIELIQKN